MIALVLVLNVEGSEFLVDQLLGFGGGEARASPTL